MSAKSNKKKVVAGMSPEGPLVIVKRVRNWRKPGEWIYPVKAKALAFRPKKRKAAK